MTDRPHDNSPSFDRREPLASPVMSTMWMLGRIGLANDDGREVDELLRQPKRLALLAFLASPVPGTWHRRDTLLAHFWPELDVARSRTALRNALYVLRRHMPDGTIRTRGDDDVSLDPAMLSTDVASFQDACNAGRHEEACGAYHGDLLPGLFVQDAEGFEKWLDDERRRLRRLAHTSSLAVATQRESSGDWRGAAAALGRAVELEPDDEASARRLMALYDGVGDRAQALATFDTLTRRLDAEFGASPSPETTALAAAIKQRRIADPSIASAVTAAVPDSLPDFTPRSDPRTDGVEPTTPGERGVAVPSVDTSRKRQWASRRVLLLAGGVVIALLAFRLTRSANATPAERALMIGRVRNMAGPSFDYVSAGLSTDLSRRLGAIEGLRLAAVSSFEVDSIADTSVVSAGRTFGSRIVLDLQLDRDGDSLQVSTSALDVTSGRRRDLGHVRFTAARIPDAASRLAASVAGAILRVPLPELPGARPPTSDSLSYRLTILGWREQIVGKPATARQLFGDAIAADPMNARAQAGLASAFSAMSFQAQLPWQDGSRSAVAAAERAIALDSTQASAWGTLGIFRALDGNLADGVALFRKGLRMEPANPEVRWAMEGMYRLAWEWDKALDAIRMARALSPLDVRYVAMEADVDFCAGRPDDA